MRSKTPTIARLLLGLVFFVFGMNGLVRFLPMPPPQGDAARFFGGLATGGYFLPLLAATQALAGLALLLGRFVPLALVVLAPVIVNIVAFHVFLAPAGIGLAMVVLGLELYLAWVYRAAFRPLLQSRPSVEPTSRAHDQRAQEAHDH
jgi:uncharacterized membrane protein YphA (DoxX/SURF4 family)